MSELFNNDLNGITIFKELPLESIKKMKSLVEILDYQDSLLFITLLFELECLPKYNNQILKPLELSYDKDRVVFENLMKRKKFMQKIGG